MARVSPLFALCAGGVFALGAPVVSFAQIAPSGTGSISALGPAEAARLAREAGADSGVEVVDGLEISLWAPPGLVANPLTLDIDADGRAFVVASARSGLLLDIRQHPDWVPEVHSLQTTEDLRAFFRRVMAPERSPDNQWLPDFNNDGSRDYRDLTVVAEQVFRVEDTDNDGVADKSQVVHEGFNEDIASDIAGGILLDGEDLYVTIAPDLWRLNDTTGDGIFDRKTSLSHGYSIHPAFAGHDMSALTIGPDGRLYWKIGDIGLNVVDGNGRRWAYPNTGAVLRSEFDGTGFEVFAWGLRNTQEMAFDAHGNLISVDNDGDHAGERERIVYIVQGSDAGWRSNWQYGKYTDSANNRYNVWMSEDLSVPQFDGQAAYITPPVASYYAGPSGFAFNPGTALSPEWRDHFFVSSFTGQSSNANIFAFTLAERGAGFELESDARVVGGLLSAGIVFGPDGALYMTDWITGWGATGEGQIWRLDARAGDRDPLRSEVQVLLQQDFAELPRTRLQSLISHSDMRIRMRAQFELAARGERQTLQAVANGDPDPLARLHGIWGLGQLARADIAVAAAIRPLLDDDSDEIRAQAARTLGDVRDAGSFDDLVALLDDEAPRVRFFATEALGRIGDSAAVDGIVSMLADNGDQDVYLRTAGFHALAGIGDATALTPLDSHQSRAVRLAAVVALRRLSDPGVAAFLDDPDPLVVTEAARAVNDEGGIVNALPALAAALDGPVRDEAFVRRAISANLRVGDEAAARRLAAFAHRRQEPEAMRAEAIAALGVWSEPSTMDRVDGAWLGRLGPRDSRAAASAVGELVTLISDPSAPVRDAVAGILESSSQVQNVGDLERAIADESLSFDVRQDAIASLARLDSAQASMLLASLLSSAAYELMPPELTLDLLVAAAASNDPEVGANISQLGADIDDLGATMPSVFERGGNAARGEQIAMQHPAAQCVRCHTIGSSESAVGPSLSTVGDRLTRRELVESLLDPGAVIVPGFGSDQVSAMPPVGALLTPLEIRDLVEFLTTLR